MNLHYKAHKIHNYVLLVSFSRNMYLNVMYLNVLMKYSLLLLI
jgi:hypothetical protein